MFVFLKGDSTSQSVAHLCLNTDKRQTINEYINQLFERLSKKCNKGKC